MEKAKDATAATQRPNEHKPEAEIPSGIFSEIRAMAERAVREAAGGLRQADGGRGLSALGDPIMVRFDSEQRRKLESLAREAGEPLSAFIRSLADGAVEQSLPARMEKLSEGLADCIEKLEAVATADPAIFDERFFSEFRGDVRRVCAQLEASREKRLKARSESEKPSKKESKLRFRL